MESVLLELPERQNQQNMYIDGLKSIVSADKTHGRLSACWGLWDVESMSQFKFKDLTTREANG